MQTTNSGLSASTSALPPFVPQAQLNAVLKLLEIARNPLPIHTAAGKYLAAQVFADPSGNIVFRGVCKPRPGDNNLLDVDDDLQEPVWPHVDVVVNGGLIWKGAQPRFTCVRRYKPGVELFVEFRVAVELKDKTELLTDAALSLLVPQLEAAESILSSALSEEQLAAAVSQVRHSDNTPNGSTK